MEYCEGDCEAKWICCYGDINLVDKRIEYYGHDPQSCASGHSVLCQKHKAVACRSAKAECSIHGPELTKLKPALGI